MYSNTAFIPVVDTAKPDAFLSASINPPQLPQSYQDSTIFSTGIYNYANSHRDTDCAAEASRIFGNNLIPAEQEDYAALAIGNATLTRSGYSDNPEAYFRDMGWTVPTGYGDYTNLIRIAGKKIIEQARNQYDQNKQLLNKTIEKADTLEKTTRQNLTTPNPILAITPEFEQDMREAGAWDSYERAAKAMAALGLATGTQGEEKAELHDANLKSALEHISGDEIALDLTLQAIADIAQKNAGKAGFFSGASEYLSSQFNAAVDAIKHSSLTEALASQPIIGEGINNLLKRRTTEAVNRFADDSEWLLRSNPDEYYRQLEQVKQNVKDNLDQYVALREFSGKVKAAIDAGRTSSDEAGTSGWIASTRRYLGQAAAEMVPFLMSGVAGVAAKGATFLGMHSSAIEQETLREREKGFTRDSALTLESASNQALGQWIGMTVGGHVIKKPFSLIQRALAKSSTGIARQLALGGARSTALNYGINAAVGAADVALIIPTATAITTAAFNLASGMPDEYSHAYNDYVSSLQQLGDPEYVTNMLLEGAIFAPVGMRDTKQRARQTLQNANLSRKAYMRAGGTKEDWNRINKLHPVSKSKRIEKLTQTLKEQFNADPITVWNRSFNEMRIAVNEKQAADAMQDSAARAWLALDGYVAEEAPDNKVRIYTEAKVNDDGSIDKGAKFYDVDQDTATSFLGRIHEGKLKQRADYLRQLMAGKLSVDGFLKLYGRSAREEILPGVQTLADMQRDAERALRKKQQLMAGDESKAEAAGKVIDPEISTELTLDALIDLPKSFEQRLGVEKERGGKGKATAAYVVPVRMGDGSTRYVLRHAANADFFALSEELGEQSLLNYQRIKQAGGDKDAQAFTNESIALDLLDLREWMKTQEQFKDVADSFLGLDASLEQKLRDGEPLTMEESQKLEHAVVEAFSSLFRSGLVSDAMEGKLTDMPTWVSNVFAASASASAHAVELATLGKALRTALSQADTPEGQAKYQNTVNQLWMNHKNAMRLLFKEYREPTETDYLKTYLDYSKRQDEQDARVGRGVSELADITEDRIRQADIEAEEEHQRQEQEEETLQQEEQKATEDLRDKPGNEEKTEEELHRERVETFADAKEEQTALDPASAEDPTFSGGRSITISADGFSDVRAGMLNISGISLSKDVPQFKRGADAETGVVNELTGLYRPDHDPIRVWERLDGSLEVISGRHRLDYARKAGATRIMAYVYKESAERDARWARTFDLEQNIRDNQATELEIALYVRGENAHGRQLSDEEIQSAGISRKGTRGELGVTLGRYAADEIIDAIRNERVSVADAVRVVEYARTERDIQREGLRVLIGEPDAEGNFTNGGSISEARRTMQRFLEVKHAMEEAGAGAEQGELFGLGFGESLQDSEFNRFFGKYQTRKLKEISADKAYLNKLVGGKLSPKQAEKYGIDIKDPDGLQKRLQELSALYEMWKNPSIHPELMEEMTRAFKEENAGQEWLDLNKTDTPVRRSHFSTEEEAPSNPSEITINGKKVDLRQAYASDAKGHRLKPDTFIRTPYGFLDWFVFPEDEATLDTLKKNGIKNLPIRLKVGNESGRNRSKQFGFLHLLKHFNQFGNESPLLALFNALTGDLRIPSGHSYRKAINSRNEGNYKKLIVDLFEEDGYYSIVTCYNTNTFPKEGGVAVRGVFLRTNPGSVGSGFPAGESTGDTTLTKKPATVTRQRRSRIIKDGESAVNIYEMQIKNREGETVFRQKREPVVDRAHFSLGGELAETFGEMQDSGLTYYDPADGKHKFCIDSRGARLSAGFTTGQLTGIQPGKHKDVSLSSMLAFPELFRAYPALAKMRVRLYRRKGDADFGVLGYFDPYSEDGTHIALNMGTIELMDNMQAQILDTLLHEAQHAIQHHEGWSHGAGGMDMKRARKYVAEAIIARKEKGVDDEWSKANLAFLNNLLHRINQGDKQAIESVYWLSHGEQEARFAGEAGNTSVSMAGFNPMTAIARMPGIGVSSVAESWMTVPVPANITPLGGITFGMAGRYAKTMDSRLAPVGDFNTDRRLFQMREAVMRRAFELAMLKDKENANEILLQCIQTANTCVNMLPNEYRFGLEPYQLWFSVFSQLGGTGNPDVAADIIPMEKWERIMRNSFRSQMADLVMGRIRKSEMEFWMADEKAKSLLARAQQIYEACREQAERMVEEEDPDKREKLVIQKTNELLAADEEMMRIEPQLYKSMGKVKAEKVMAKLLERVKLKLDEYRKDKTLGRIRRVVDSVLRTPGKDGKPVKGKMDSEHYKKLENYLLLLDMKKGELEAWMEEHYPEDGDIRMEDEPLDKLVSITTYDRFGKEQKREFSIAEINTYASFESMSADAAERMSRALGEFISTGRNAWDNALQAHRNQIVNWCTPLLRATGALTESDMAAIRTDQRKRPLWLAFDALRSFFAPGMNDVQFFDSLSGDKLLAPWASDIKYRLAHADNQYNFDQNNTIRIVSDILTSALGTDNRLRHAEYITDMRMEQDTGIILTPQKPDYFERESAVIRKQILGLLQRKVEQKNFAPHVFAPAIRHYLKRNKVTPEMRAAVDLNQRPAGVSAQKWAEIRFLVGLEKEILAKYGHHGKDFTKLTDEGNALAYHTLFSASETNRIENAAAQVGKRVKKALAKWEGEHAKKFMNDVAQYGQSGEKSQTLRISKAEAAYQLLLCKQDDLRPLMESKGYTEAVIARLEAFVGKDMLGIAYKLREALNARTERIAEMYERIYGVPFPRVDNYFRAFFDVTQVVDTATALESHGNKAAAGKGKEGILRTRSKSLNKKLDLTVDVFGAFETAMKEQSVFLNYGLISRDLTSIVNFKDGKFDMANSLTATIGESGVSQLRQWADAINWLVPQSEAATGFAMRCISAMQGVMAKSLLSMRAGTALKQWTALFNSVSGSDYINFREWMTSKARVLGGHGIISLKDMAARPALAGRFRGRHANAIETAIHTARGKHVSHKADKINNDGMTFLEYEDSKANIYSATILYDAVYRKLKKANPEMSASELDTAAMAEVELSLATKSQPLNFRQKSLDATKTSIWKIGGLFLGSESVNTFGKCVSLATKGGKGNWGKAVQIWLTHGFLLQAMQFGLDWLIDDEKRHNKRTFLGYLLGTLFGPISGIPFISQLFQSSIMGLQKWTGTNIPVYVSSGLLPFADIERTWNQLQRDIKILTGQKKNASWENTAIAFNDIIRTGSQFTAMGAAFGTSKGAAIAYGSSLAAAAVSNLLDFLLKVTRTFEADRK